jgi:uncharacterized protein with FMN-binding domain
MINSSNSRWRSAGGLAALMAGVGLVVGLKAATGGASTAHPVALPPAVAPVTSGTSTTTGAPASSAAQPTSSAPPTPSSRQVLGDVAQTPYGPVQIELVLTGTRIVDVRALQTPDAASRSRVIASIAVPQLRSEVLTAQAARIDTVSGATYTSQGYAESVQYAIDHE